jgi:hypothetical protein
MRRPRALGKPAPPSDKPLRHLARQKEIGLTERHIQETVTAFLEADGWRPLRMEHAIERKADGGFRRRVGEVGMPDYLYLRYEEACNSMTAVSIGMVGMAEAMWIEFKAPGKSADPHQLDWHEAERLGGGLVLVVNDIDEFRAWYAKSGLSRK